MKRYDILEKVDKKSLFSGKHNNFKDKKASKWGASAIYLVLILFGLINYISGKDNYQILAIFGAYIGFQALGRYIASKNKLDLVFAIGGILILIGTSILEISKILNI